MNPQIRFTDDEPIRIVRSASFEDKQQLIRQMVLKHVGSFESVLELGGTVIGSHIFVTDGLIPRAQIGYARFEVKDRDLSACWSAAEKSPSTKHLLPVGDLHYHPGRGLHFNGQCAVPAASQIDEQNSLRQAGLYFPFNLQSTQNERVLSPESAGSDDNHACYRIDEQRSILLPNPGDGGSLSSILYKEKRRRSLWGSLIYHSDACSDAVLASAIIHAYCACDPDNLQVLHLENVESLVLPDEEVAKLTGWPLEKIKLRTEPEAIKDEVCEKYSVSCGGYNPFPYTEGGWGHGQSLTGGNAPHLQAHQGGQPQPASQSTEEALKSVAGELKTLVDLLKKKTPAARAALTSGLEIKRIDTIEALLRCVDRLQSSAPAAVNAMSR